MIKLGLSIIAFAGAWVALGVVARESVPIVIGAVIGLIGWVSLCFQEGR